MEYRRLAVTSLDRAIVPLAGDAHDSDGLLEMIGDAPLVLIGEATHGTHEFYHTRAEITKRLIAERGFNVVCIEGDWPDAYRVNRYVRGAAEDPEATDALGGFRRFPSWMWRNADVLDFVGWLRAYNDRAERVRAPKAGFYGLDLYSMYASIEAVLEYLDRVDPETAAKARSFYACLEPYAESPETYGAAAFHGVQENCRHDVLRVLLAIQKHASQYARHDGKAAEDEYFYALHNARVVANAESYYRAMLEAPATTWNLRDRHMVETMQELMIHLAGSTGTCKAVVWAHNSHLGNAEATSMHLHGETNVGALSRAAYGNRCVSVGFTTYSGTVTAASDWHAAAERKNVRPAVNGSYERLFHTLGTPRFWLPLSWHRPYIEGLPDRARERAIGVVYRPQTELQSHYFTARLIHQFDGIYHYDTTRAVEPLDRGERWIQGEVPETYPSGD